MPIIKRLLLRTAGASPINVPFERAAAHLTFRFSPSSRAALFDDPAASSQNKIAAISHSSISRLVWIGRA